MLLLALDVAAFSYVAASVVRRMYGTAPKAVLFVDCDDCCYQNEWATAKKITNSIASYTARIGVTKEQAYELYQRHGTCLKGLLAEGRIDDPFVTR